MNTKTNKAPAIPMTAVKSSQIESIGHLGGTLAVKFKSGSTYHYPGVTADQFADLHKSDSIGKAFNAFKIGREFKKIGG
jgi:hypothetical protein